MMHSDMSTAPSKRAPGTGTWVKPTDDLVQARPELEGDVGEVICSEEQSAVVQWKGQPKPYRVPSDYLDPAAES